MGFDDSAGLVILAVYQKNEQPPSASIFVVAILISSILFGLGHLPVAFMLFPEPTATLVFFVIAANSAFGMVAGILYWRRGLESGQ